MRKLALFLALLTPCFARAQSVAPFSDQVLSASGRPIGAPVAICTNPGLTTTAASVMSNLVVLTMSSNPIVAGFAANQTIAVSGFSGADTYLNGGTVSSTGISGGFTILSVTSTQITYQLSHVNTSATSNGSVFQAGSTSQTCAPLASIFSDPVGGLSVTQPGLTSDGFGNYQFYAAPGTYYAQFYGAILGLRLKPVWIAPSTATSNTWTQPQTFTGNVTATAGQNSIGGYKFNTKVFVENNKYTTPEVAIAACPTSPIGCTVYHEDFTSTSAGFTLGGSPSVNYFGQRMTLGAAARINLNGKISLLDSGELIGGNEQTSLIIPGSSFSASTPMIDIGDNSNQINAGMDYLRINANGAVTAQTAVRARGTNDNSRFRFNVIQNYTTNCMSFDGTSVNTGLNLFEGNMCAAGSGAASDGFSFKNAKNQLLLRTTTVSNAGASISAAGIHFFGASINSYVHTVINHHNENYSDALNVDGNQSVVAIGIDGGGTPGTNNTIHIPSTGGGIFVGIGLHNNNTSSSVVKNDVTGTTISANNPPLPFGMLPFYWWMRTAGDEGWIDFGGLHVRSTTGGLVINRGSTITSSGAGGTMASVTGTLTTGHAASFNDTVGTLKDSGLVMPTAAGSATVTQTIASGTATMTTAAITAGNCGATVTVSASGVATTDTITWAFNAAPAGSNGGLVAWPTPGNVNFAYCPNSAETPAAATINWRVIR